MKELQAGLSSPARAAALGLRSPERSCLQRPEAAVIDTQRPNAILPNQVPHQTFPSNPVMDSTSDFPETRPFSSSRARPGGSGKPEALCRRQRGLGEQLRAFPHARGVLRAPGRGAGFSRKERPRPRGFLT